MLRRIALVLIALALVATAAGCGSGSSSGGLETALKYVPKDAPLVVAFDTDPKGEQWKQVEELVGKFPFGGQFKQGFRTGFNGRSGLDFDKDFKPLLGNDAVVAVTSSDGLKDGAQTPFVVAWKVKDEDKAKALVKKNAKSVGKVGGVEAYQGNSGSGVTAIKNGTLVSANTEAALGDAFKRADGEHLSEDSFNSSLGDLPKDSLVRVTGDFQAILDSSPEAANARKVKWIAALRTFGFTVTAEKDGLATAFSAKTEGGLTATDLPIAEGEEAAPVVRRAGEIGFGIRDPAQIVKFAEQAAQATDTQGYADYAKEKAKVSKQLGVDVDKDLIEQLTGNAALSVSLDSKFAVRAELRDPAAAEATLKKVAPRLVKLSKAKGKSLGLSTPKNGKGFYALAQANGDKLVFGVVGKSFVAATDASRAAQFAGQSPSAVPGAKGAVVVASDARALANAIAQQQGRGTAAQIVTGALGNLVGSMEANTGALDGKLKLEIK